MVKMMDLTPERATSANYPAWLPYAVAGILCYTMICSATRFNRCSSMLKRYNYTDRKSLGRMTNVEAQFIMCQLAELEFPKIYYTSVHPENAGKRYADTTVLIQEFAGHHPTSDRVIKAIARMNYIHSRYQKAGKISNEDLLYTLSVFITEPIRWVEKYEWRSMNDLEEYELEFMVPAKSNKITANELIPLLLFYVPYRLRSVGSRIVGVMMGQRLRAAMMYPTPSPIYFRVVKAVFEFRRFVLRYLALPRPSFMRVRELSDQPDPKTGRFHINRYVAHPFYDKPGFLNRWGPEGIFVWIAGGDRPGSKGSLYLPEGYNFEEVGPKIMRNRGLEETQGWEGKLKAERPAGCPFAFK